MKRDTVDQFTAIMPSPGWQCWSLAEYDDGQREFSEIPVIGWAVVRRRDTYDPEWIAGDDLELMVWADSCAQVSSYVECSNTVVEVIAPGESLEVTQAAMSERLDPKLKSKTINRSA